MAADAASRKKSIEELLFNGGRNDDDETSGVDSTLFGAGKYHYFYDDENDSFGRLGSGAPIFSSLQFTNNGVCEDGLPSSTGNPSKAYRLYLYPNVITSGGANPRSFGTATPEGVDVLTYYPCAIGKDCHDCGPRTGASTKWRFAFGDTREAGA